MTRAPRKRSQPRRRARDFAVAIAKMTALRDQARSKLPGVIADMEADRSAGLDVSEIESRLERTVSALDAAEVELAILQSMMRLAGIDPAPRMAPAPHISEHLDYREALVAAHAYAAAGLVLGIDSLVPHPVTQREIYKQIDKHNLWLVKAPKDRKQKNATSLH